MNIWMIHQYTSELELVSWLLVAYKFDLEAEFQLSMCQVKPVYKKLLKWCRVKTAKI